jgi:hypothetical protein
VQKPFGVGREIDLSLTRGMRGVFIDLSLTAGPESLSLEL